MGHVYRASLMENAQNIIQKDFAIKYQLMGITSLNAEGDVLPNKWS